MDTNSLPFSRPPIAIGFLQEEPTAIARWGGGQVPAGCAFWKRAWAGEAFYTVPSDHFNCAVGSHTHSIRLPQERAGELEQAIGLMTSSGYLQMQEVAGIPTLAKPPKFIAYGPADDPKFAADVVLVAARPEQLMTVYESALRAGAAGAILSSIGRPGCAVLPLATASTEPALSFGCKGNRTYTGIGDAELYLAVPAAKWATIVAALAEIVRANDAMGEYYEAQAAKFASA
jgi:uncharacterized protein (DUF169 family)